MKFVNMTRWARQLLLLVAISQSSLALAADRYSFLWVLDNGPAFQQRYKKIGDHFKEFLTALQSKKPLDYRMAVTTTDFFSDNGNLAAGASGKTVVDNRSADPVGDFVSILSTIAAKESPTSFWREGLESSYQAILRHGAEFMEPKAPLIIIYVTDDDDFSCGDKCWGVEPIHNDNFLEFSTGRYFVGFNKLKESHGAQVSVFPMIGVPGSACQITRIGSRYQMVEPPGGFGVTSDVCDNQIALSLIRIAHTIAQQP